MANATSAPAKYQRRVCYFSGRVQGVGFRYTVSNLALRFNVHGFVRNTDDGRVELIVEGDPAEIDHLIAAINQKMDGFIRKATADVQPPTGEYDHFFVQH